MSDLPGFQLAKVRAEAGRQVAEAAARRAFDAALLGANASGRQRTYDAALQDAWIAYYEKVIAAADRFGIEANSCRVGLDERPRRPA